MSSINPPPVSRKKKCEACGYKKPKEEFYTPESIRGFRTCTACRTSKNTRYSRKVKLRRVYNLSETEYTDMLASQNYTCAICGVDISEGKACLDHNHSTGKLRAFLCDPCNRGLGHFNDDAKLLLKAVKYLEKHSR